MLKQAPKYYVAEFFGEQPITAGVVRQDNEIFMEQNEYKAIRFCFPKNKNILSKILRLLQAFLIVFQCNKNATVVFHFPMQATVYVLLQKILHWRTIKTVVIIIDIDGLRDNNTALLQKEITQLKNFDVIIAHNNAMKDYLLGLMPHAKIFNIQMFDYRSKENAPNKELSNKVCYAGNLAKAPFLKMLNELKEIHFNLYGQGYDESWDKNINCSYHGIVAADELPTKLQGSFGMVWDGDSLAECDEYLRYNNPHKLSLYLLAGLPVIVWKQSAVANFVKEKNIGIEVGSLYEVAAAIAAITPSDYSAMLQEASKLSPLIANGFFLKEVLKEAVSV